MTIRTEDREVLLALAKNGCRFGDTLAELSAATGFTTQRIAAVAKRYDGQRLGRLTVSYFPPQSATYKSCQPGIANPRTGICERIPATVAVVVKRKRVS